MSKLLIVLKGRLYCLWYNMLRWEQDRLMSKSAKQIKKLTVLNEKTAAANARVLAFQETVVKITTGLDLSKLNGEVKADLGELKNVTITPIAE